MRPAQVIQITTPKKFLLNGLWFGPKRPKQAIIFTHGLTGSAFSAARIIDALVDKTTAVISFNNRGFEQVAAIKRLKGRDIEYLTIGAAHEVFAESIDDVQGAVDFVRRQGVRSIFLAGHSTGAQKIIYWASKSKRKKSVRGLILLGPLSDYAGTQRIFARALRHAQRLVRKGKPHELMPKRLGPWFVCDAQRFVSLYSGEGPEEIFTYAQPKKIPRVLKSVRIPILVLLAGADEHGDRPAKKIGDWFAEHLKIGDEIVIVPKVKHSFKGGERMVAKAIHAFMK